MINIGHTGRIGHWEIEKIESQISSLEGVVERYAESIENLSYFEDCLLRHDISLNTEVVLGFSPAKVLQLAQADINHARSVLKTYERFGKGNPIAYERAVEELPAMISARRKIVESSMEITEEFHCILEDIYGKRAALAWAEAQEEQLVAHYLAAQPV